VWCGSPNQPHGQGFIAAASMKRAGYDRLIAARAIVTGTLEMIAAIRLRKEISGEWLLAVSGALSVAFGVFLFVFPGPGALGLLLWIGAYAMVVGALLVGLGFRLRSVKRRVFGEGGPSAGRFAGSH
jgi:uncharacterized membrane protein HdeD (DUF308 family)